MLVIAALETVILYIALPTLAQKNAFSSGLALSAVNVQPILSLKMPGQISNELVIHSNVTISLHHGCSPGTRLLAQLDCCMLCY